MEPAERPPDPDAKERGTLRFAVVVRGVVAVVVGVCILALLVAFAGMRDTLDEVRSADWTYVWLAAGVLSLQIPVLGLRWWFALRALGDRVSPLLMIRINTASNLVNFAMPGHFGEATTSYWLSRTQGIDGVAAFSALITCKVMGSLVNTMAALGLILALGAAQVGAAGIWLGAGSGVAVLVAFALLLNGTTGDLIGRVLERCVRLGMMGTALVVGRERAGALSERAGSWIGSTWASFRGVLEVLVGRPAVLATLLAISVVRTSFLVLCLHFVLVAVGIADGLSWMAEILVAVLNGLSYFVSVQIPLNLGGQEAVIYGCLEALGQPAGAALAVAVLFRLATLVEKGISLLWVLALAPFHPMVPDGASSGGATSAGAPP